MLNKGFEYHLELIKKMKNRKTSPVINYTPIVYAIYKM